MDFAIPPPPVNISQHFGLPNNCARIGSLLSAPAACYMHAPAPEPQGVDLRALAEAPLGRGALCSFIASVKKNGVTKASPSGRTFFLLPYSPTPFLVGLAGFLRTPTRFPWRLQHSCKDQPYFRGTCSIPANANRISAAFAAFLQRPTVSPRPLQHSCKCQPYLRGTCCISAKTNRISAAFAAFLQMPTVSPRPLQRSCKQCRKSDYSFLKN